MLPGAEGIHHWRAADAPEGSFGTIEPFLLGAVDPWDGRIFPCADVKEANSGTLADGTDNADGRVGASGEIARRSFRRGKTHVFSGNVVARSLADFRTFEEEMKAAFASQEIGQMWAGWHPDVPTIGDTIRTFYARPIACEIGEPIQSRSEFKARFVVAMRNHDGGYFSGFWLVPYAVDDFDSHSVGALTGKTPPEGFFTAAYAGSGDSDDFQVAAGGVVTRTLTNDASLTTGRQVRLAGQEGSVVSVDVTISATSSSNNILRGAMLRWVNASNFVYAAFRGSAGVVITKVIGGTGTQLDSGTLGENFEVGVPYRLVARAAGTAGQYEVFAGRLQDDGSIASDTPICEGTDSALANGGTLEDGDCGLYDANSAGVAMTRTYDNLKIGQRHLYSGAEGNTSFAIDDVLLKRYA